MTCGILLTDESFDSERFNLHVDQETTVRLNQRGGLGNCSLGLCLLDYSVDYTVDQAKTK